MDRAAVPDGRAGVLTGRIVARAAPALVVVGTCVGVLLHVGTPVRGMVTYAAYLALGVVLPGTVVHRALRGVQESWLVDLALGATWGLCLELAAWAAVSMAGGQRFLAAWPAAALLVLVPRVTRARVLQTPRTRLPVWCVVALTGALLALVWHVADAYLDVRPILPSGRPLYVDLPWHMSLASEAARSFPPQIPQVIGDGALKYHWFAHAHLASAHLVTGIDIPLIVLRLWVLPMELLAVLMTVAFAWRLSGRPVAGVLAGWLMLPPMTLAWWAWAANRLDHLTASSPTQLYSFPVTLLCGHAVVDIVRGRATRGTWVVAVVSAAVCAGAKASALPILLGGVGVALLAALVRRRGWRPAAALVAVLGATAVAGALFVQGGSAGSGVQVFSNLSSLQAYRLLVDPTVDFTPHILPGLVGAGSAGLKIVGFLVVLEAVRMARTVALVLTPMVPRLRSDPGAWFVTGVCLAGLLALVLIGHQAYSEYYFAYGTVPFGAGLASWALTELADHSRSLLRTTLAGLGTGAFAGAVFMVVSQPSWRAQHRAVEPTARSAVMLTAAGIVVLLTVAYVARRAWGRGRDRPPVLRAVSVSVAAGVVLASAVGQELTGPERTLPTSSRVALAQSEAGLWIADNVPQLDVMAVNDHCRGPERLSCPSLQFWVSGIGGRRVLVEGWSYTPLGAHAPFHDPGLYALNQSAFTDPTASTLDAMRAKGVRWLVATRGETPVSARLDSLAARAYDNGTVVIYRLGS